MTTRPLDVLARRLSASPSRRVLVRSVVGALAAAAARGGAVRGAVQDATPCPAATPEEVEAIARAYFDAFNAGDADALGALLADDYVHQGALVNQQDKAVHQERLRTNRTAFPDGRYELQDVIVDGDLVAVRHVFTGTLQAPYAGAEPAGQPVAVRGVHIHRIACGLIAETWNNGDGLGLLRQIGALPGAGPAPRTPLGTPVAAPAPATPAGCPEPSAEASAALARRWTEEALDAHDPSVLDEIVDPNVVHHGGIFADDVGLAALKETIEELYAGFSDLRYAVDVVVAEGDRAAVRWTARGTHDGPLQGLAATGIAVSYTGTNTYRIACGKIVEAWSEPDALGLLRQLGAVSEVAPVVGTPTAS